MSLSKSDWLDAGLDVLGKSGPAGLTIERLTTKLGVTKGSFYHHFHSITTFERALVTHWAEQYLTTADLLPPDPPRRLALLDQIMSEGFAAVTEPEMAIRAWALQDPAVAAIVSRVDQLRRRFVRQVLRAQIPDEPQADLLADMLFAMAIGTITTLPPISPARMLAMYVAFKDLSGLAPR